MPFTDGVRATVTVSDALSEEEMAELLSRFSAFTRDHSDEPVAITVREGAITLPVFGDASVTLQARDAASALGAEPDVESVSLSATSDSEQITGVSVQVSPDLDAAFSVARSAPERLAPLAARSRLHLTVKDAGTSVRISGVPGRWLDEAEAAWTMVSAAFPVSGVRADTDALTLTLVDEADAAGAQALVARADPAFQTPIRFASPIVLLGLNSTGDKARLMLNELDADTRDRIRYVWSNDVRAEFSVATTDDVATVKAALSALPQASRGGLEVSVVEAQQ